MIKPILWLHRYILTGLLLLCASTAWAEQPDTFISAETVHKAPSQYKIIDARGKTAYLKGHIPDALVTDWQAFSDMRGKPGDSQWATLDDHKKLEDALQQLGLNSSDQIVVYGSRNGWGEAGRVLWTLCQAGFNQSFILDGGYPYWKQQGYSTSLIPTLFPKKSQFKLTDLNNRYSINTEQLLANYAKWTVIDTRTPQEYQGSTDHGEARGGHMPGAINLPFTALLNKDGRVKSNKEIAEIMARLGITKNTPIVTYCTAGIRSAHMAMVLTGAGFTEVKNYAPSFYHWAALGSTQLIKGKDPE